MAEESEDAAGSHEPSGVTNGPRKRPRKKSAEAHSPPAERKEPPITGGGSSTNATAGDSTASDPLGHRWRRLAALTISMNTFANDVSHVAERWPYDKRLNDKERSKAASHVARLATHGKNLRNSMLAFVCRIESRPKDSAAKQLEAAWKRLQGIDLAQRLQGLIEALGRINSRLREAFSPDVMAKINEDFHTLTADVRRLNTEADAIRTSLKTVLPDAGISDTLNAALKNLIEAITMAITATSKGEGISDTWLDHGRFSIRLPERLKRAAAVRKAYEALEAAFGKECDERLKALIGRDPKRVERFEGFLVTVRMMIHTVRSTHEFAQMTDEAASQGIDYEVSKEAAELQDHLAAVQLASGTLHEMVERYSDIVSRAPFKRTVPSKPMPAWQRLSQDERDVLAGLIALRAAAPEGQLYSVVQQTLETELDHRFKYGKLKRLLDDLEEVYGIVGKYQPTRSNTEQQPSYGYWVEEYAYAFYGRHVFGEAWVPPSTDPKPKKAP